MTPTDALILRATLLACLAACAVPEAPDPVDQLLPVEGRWSLTQYERRVDDCDLAFIVPGSPITELRTAVVDRRLFLTWGRLGIIQQTDIRCPTAEDRTFACRTTSQSKRYHNIDDRVQTLEITLKGYLLEVDTEIEFYATAEEICEGADCEGTWCTWHTTGRLVLDSELREREQP